MATGFADDLHFSIARAVTFSASIFRQSLFSVPAHPDPVAFGFRTVTLNSARVCGRYANSPAEFITPFPTAVISRYPNENNCSATAGSTIFC